mmetsp:Transcript_76271/g.246988  ORF Transcript_76271/g.246988 Transcript_76271/m.246988 type:complete len:214 (+) Transcript_76271:997-1638(+)
MPQVFQARSTCEHTIRGQCCRDARNQQQGVASALRDASVFPTSTSACRICGCSAVCPAHSSIRCGAPTEGGGDTLPCDADFEPISPAQRGLPAGPRGCAPCRGAADVPPVPNATSIIALRLGVTGGGPAHPLDSVAGGCPKRSLGQPAIVAVGAISVPSGGCRQSTGAHFQQGCRQPARRCWRTEVLANGREGLKGGPVGAGLTRWSSAHTTR